MALNHITLASSDEGRQFIWRGLMGRGGGGHEHNFVFCTQIFLEGPVMYLKHQFLYQLCLTPEAPEKLGSGFLTQEAPPPPYQCH